MTLGRPGIAGVGPGRRRPRRNRSLEPFPVICETCRARLRVRDPGIIGEIHACPKCGSMVLITPPADWSAGEAEAPAPPTEATQPSPEATETVSNPAAEPVAEPVSTPTPSVPPPTTTVHQVDVAAEVPELDALLGQTAAATGEAMPMPAPEPMVPPTPPGGPLANRWIVLAAAGASLVVVGGLLVAMWGRGGEDTLALPSPTDTATFTAPASPSDEATVTAPGEDESQPAAAADDGEKTAANEQPNEAGGANEPPVALGGHSVPPQPPDALPTPNAPSTSDIVAASEPPAVLGGRSAVPQPPADHIAAVSPQFDPLDFDPTQLSLSRSGVAEIVPEDDESEDASDGLGGLPVETADTAASDGTPDGPDAASPPSATAVVRLGPGSSEATRRRDVAEQLSLELDEIDLPRVPLVRVLDLISGLADVPITLEPEGLAMTGVSPAFPITLQAENVSMGDLLTQALAQCHLAYEARDGVIVVTKPDVDRQRSVNYRVDDLMPAGATDATPVARLIERFVVPDSWQTAGGSGTVEVDGDTLRVHQTDRVLYQILTFCERLRLARGLAPRSRYPVARLHVEPAYRQLAERFSADTTFTFLPWTPLRDVFDYWQTTTGVTVLVDWGELADAELAPTTPVACAVADRPWGEAIDAVLEPLGLAWRAVDGKTIQITTLDAASRVRQIEFYPVTEPLLAQYADHDALVTALVNQAKTQATGDTATIDVALDEPSDRLIVRAPAAVQRHLTAWLASQ